jgi:hypothetical protein
VALVQRGALERLPAVGATAAGLAALAVPFAVMGAEPGLEILHPMAVVVLGGLLTSTLVALFLVPSLFLRHGSTPRPRLEFGDAVVEESSGAPDAAERYRVPQPAGAAQAHGGNGRPGPGAIPASLTSDRRAPGDGEARQEEGGAR